MPEFQVQNLSNASLLPVFNNIVIAMTLLWNTLRHLLCQQQCQKKHSGMLMGDVTVLHNDNKPQVASLPGHAVLHSPDHSGPSPIQTGQVIL
jgi:hypothetical protein